MSRVVYYKGKLKKVDILGLEIEEYCKKELANKELPFLFENFKEYFLYEKNGKYAIINNELFKVERNEIAVDDSFFFMDKNDDGSYNFDVMYYNGGCSFEEALNEAYESYKEAEK